MREYHFFKMGLETREAIAYPPDQDEKKGLTREEQISRDALVAFMAEYDLPHLQPRLTPEAAQEILADHKAGTLPRFALKALRLKEVRAAARR